MSNFFEQELRKLFGDGEIIHDPVFVGRACLGSLGAVSYTHLDVYKRQILICLPGWAVSGPD